jgi:hypothetical protein
MSQSQTYRWDGAIAAPDAERTTPYAGRVDVLPTVAGVVAIVAAVHAAVWILVLRDLRQVRERAQQQFGSTALLGPERIQYQGSLNGRFPKVRGLVVATVTPDALIVQRQAARDFRVSRRDIRGVRQQLDWKGRLRNGAPHVVVTTQDDEFGLQVADPDRWVATLQGLASE